MTTGVHPTAARGFVTPDVYERGRPDYATDAVDALGIGAGSDVVDLGCGTGKFTRQLIATGANVIGVEPLPTMLAGLRDVLPDARAVAGLAEAIPLKDAACDVVVCASAFHWFDHARALPEIHRVLRDGGELAIVWNRRDKLDGWSAGFFEITERYRGDTPGYRSGKWERGIADSGLFGPISDRYFDHVQRTDLDGLLARIESISFIELLPEQTKGSVLDECRAFIASHPETTGRTTFDLPYRTSLYTVRKNGD